MQAMHDMLAYRYLEMYSEHKDEVNETCRKIYKEVNKEWARTDISFGKRMKYQLLYKIPFIYRILRIVMDPTTVEKGKGRTEKKKGKKIK